MGKFAIAAAAIGLAIVGFSVADAATVYIVDQNSTVPLQPRELSPLSDSVTGTITTDGKIGAIEGGDVVSWDLHLTDNLRPGDDSHLTPLNSELFFDDGDALTASATKLSFDYGNSAGLFLIQGTTYGAFSGYQYLCFAGASSTCYAGESIVPYLYSSDGVLVGLTSNAPLDGVPEPAAWTVMLLGCFGVGAGLRSRRRLASLAV